MDAETRRVIATGSPLSPLDADIIGSLSMNYLALDSLPAAPPGRHGRPSLDVESSPDDIPPQSKRHAIGIKSTPAPSSPCAPPARRRVALARHSPRPPH